ncbi:MAG: M42 family metallopeptidase [Anaerolineaceae bacterium]|nr:M42 family metallopeptidase [Anaerolineaceae bacterium]
MPKTATLPEIDYKAQEVFLVDLLKMPSPSGHTADAIQMVEEALKAYPEVKLSRTLKGALLAIVPGRKHELKRGLTAHADTLGAMVKFIKPSGRLELTNVGGWAPTSVEAESCTIFTRKRGSYRGSYLPVKASVHVYGQAARDEVHKLDNMEVRIDERVSSAEETRKLGIEVGDYVAFDARPEAINGFVRSRHLDDKACVANILSAIKSLYDAGLKPAYDSAILISNYEETGFGGTSDVPTSIEEFVAVDMAAIGEGQASDEFHASICVKDASGPYHHALSNKLREIADKYQIPYKTDIYVNYGSDAKAYWHGGGNAAIALIGPGVDSSHHYERVHQEGMLASTQWIMAYLLEE